MTTFQIVKWGWYRLEHYSKRLWVALLYATWQFCDARLTAATVRNFPAPPRWPYRSKAPVTYYYGSSSRRKERGARIVDALFTTPKDTLKSAWSELQLKLWTGHSSTWTPKEKDVIRAETVRVANRYISELS